ncbi:TPA: MarR family transcriptional regulator [Photobacterium damselae]
MEAARFAPYQFGLINLSKTQLKVLRSINPGEEVTSEQIAERCNLSSSWASTLLKTVWERGYLKRTTFIRKGGGVVFIYAREKLSYYNIVRINA